MPRIVATSIGASPFRRIMSHRPEIAQDWGKLDELIRFTGVLDPELKEEVRRALAQTGGCAFCASLGEPKEHYDDPKVTAAVQFAAAVGRAPSAVSDAVWSSVRSLFSDEELIELCTWICFMYGSEMFGGLMRLDAADPSVSQMYSDYVKRGTEAYRRQYGLTP